MIVAEYTIPGAHIRDHEIAVPLNWRQPEGKTITLFSREVVDPTRKDADLPMLVFFQGGPGGKSPRPTGRGPSWLAEALKTHRVVLPDQRGTGAARASKGAPWRSSQAPRRRASICRISAPIPSWRISSICAKPSMAAGAGPR